MKVEDQGSILWKLPKEWDIKKIKNINSIKLTMGQSPPSSTYNKEGIGLPFFQGKNEFGYIYPKPIIYCAKPQRIAEQNDILLSVRAPVGDVNIAPFKCCIGRGLASLKIVDSKLDFLYLFYFLKFNKRKFESISMGSTFKAIRKTEIENFEIVIPPINEQQKIAEILSTVDKAIQKSDQIIKKTERLKQGAMQKLLSKGIRHKKFKRTSIGRIPFEWNVLRIKDIGKVITGTTPSTKINDYWGPGVPFITPGDIDESVYVYKTEREVTKKGSKRGRLVPKNSVMVVCIGSTIGKVALSSNYCITNQQINTIICNENIYPLYIYYILLLRKNFLRNMAGIAVAPIIKKSLFEIFKIPLPSYSEQKQIADIIYTIDKKIELEKKRKEKLIRLKKGLMNDLLTGKKRVKIGG